MSQIKKNIIYNILYQILTIILPLITVPYVSRVLGTEGIGIYSYTYSIVYYFIIISLLGINNHGNRTIAKVRENKEELSKQFISIYLIQLFMTFLMILLYVLYLILFNIEYKLIATIQIIYLISTIFDINWFFFGLEKFKITVTRSTIIKILSLVLIFCFVKSNNDLWKYTIILSGSALVSQLLLLPFLFKEIKIIQVDFNSIKQHIKPIITLFVPVIAISLYKVMDKVMLGLLNNVSEVGLYEQAEKITQMPLCLITAFGTVMMPRAANLFSKNKITEILNYINKSITFIMFLCLPIVFGLISISNDFIPIFLGKDFLKSSILLNILATTIVFISFANVLRTQYLIPNNRDKDYIASVVLGALINLTLNIILIPHFMSIGACIATVVAEATVCIYQCFALRKELEIKKYISNSMPFLIKALIMFVLVCLTGLMIYNVYIRIIVQVLSGIIIYSLLNYRYIISIINNKKEIKVE